MDLMFTYMPESRENMLHELLEKVLKKDFTLVVLGLGRVGLPLALSFASNNVRVVGVDVNQELIESLRNGTAPFYEPGIDKLLRNTLDRTFFVVDGSKAEDIVELGDVFIIAVGTPLTHDYQPDYTQLISALKPLANPRLRGKAVILRSTIAPGTTENFAKPFLEKGSGLTAGVDFALAMCPERIAEGKALEELKTLPEIVGGINEISSRIAGEVFRLINPNKHIIYTKPIIAELAKLFTNVYRYVNFALANEFALIAEQYNVDAREVIRIANENYPRGGIPMPGLTGGPCLSKDGYYLLQKNIFPEFILMAWRLNEYLPTYIANKVAEELGKLGKSIYDVNVGVLGLSYKKDIDDVRYSPAERLVRILKGLGIKVHVHDPYVRGTEDLDTVIRDSDVLIIAVNHTHFNGIEEKINNNAKKLFLIYDVWGIIDPKKLRRKVKYLRFGGVGQWITGMEEE